MAGVENIVAAQAGLNRATQFIGAPEAVAGPHVVHIGAETVAGQQVEVTPQRASLVVLPGGVEASTQGETSPVEATASTQGGFSQDVVRFVRSNLDDPHRRAALLSTDRDTRTAALDDAHSQMQQLEPRVDGSDPTQYDARVAAAVMLTEEIAISPDPERRVAGTVLLEEVRFPVPHEYQLKRGLLDAVATAESMHGTEEGRAEVLPGVLDHLIDAASILAEHLPRWRSDHKAVVGRIQQAVQAVPEELRGVLLDKAENIYPPKVPKPLKTETEAKAVLHLADQGFTAVEISEQLGTLSAPVASVIIQDAPIDTDEVRIRLSASDRERLSVYEAMKAARLARGSKLKAHVPEKNVLRDLAVDLTRGRGLNPREIAALAGVNPSQIRKILEREIPQ